LKNQEHKYSTAALKLGFITLGLGLLGLILMSIHPVFAFFLFIPIFLGGVLSLIGAFYSFKGIKEIGSWKKYLGLIMNVFFTALFLYFVFAYYLKLYC
jgi:hypothetical protein